MALAVTFNFLVVRKSAIAEKYPGGIEQFRRDWIKEKRRRISRSFGEDEHLFGFSSMGRYFNPVIEALSSAGFTVDSAQPSSFLAFGSLDAGFSTPCDWLELEELPEPENAEELRKAYDPFPCNAPYLLCWLSGQERGEIIEAEPY